ncbi:hypothetical protein BpHYR1_042990 [Brachionus plicatilis]|uniref:Uncharacterized protein n=1 Tax=Brachionus plicatilis TaxID=10195 RepID=A0A3M7PP65_BRAPC|nr:hypothetical protein BpHYR1_042990 [Brachionus plicatilis]
MSPSQLFDGLVGDTQWCSSPQRMFLLVQNRKLGLGYWVSWSHSFTSEIARKSKWDRLSQLSKNLMFCCGCSFSSNTTKIGIFPQKLKIIF